MVNQEKGVQQDTAYSAVVVNDHMYPRPCLYNVSMTCHAIDGPRRSGGPDVARHKWSLCAIDGPGML